MAGRKAGTPNKFTTGAKDNVAAVFNRLGGTAEMAKWAKANQTEFYKLYARLIPVEHSGEVTIHDARELTDAALAAIAASGGAGTTKKARNSSESDGVVH